LVKWEVFTNAYNQTYLYCHQTKATAYVANNEVLHYFTEFYGDKNSLLYHFYLGAHKIVMGFYQDLEVTDTLPISVFHLNVAKILHDFTAPFFQYIKTTYVASFTKVDDPYFPQHVEIASSIKAHIGNAVYKKIDFHLLIQNNQVQQFNISKNKETITAVCIN
jgi:hypothetical protein